MKEHTSDKNKRPAVLASSLKGKRMFSRSFCFKGKGSKLTLQNFLRYPERFTLGHVRAAAWVQFIHGKI